MTRTLSTWLGACTLAWGGIALALVLASRKAPSASPLPPVVEPAARVGEAEELVAKVHSVVDRIERGDTLSSVLERNGVSSQDVHEMARALSAVMDVRHLRVGDEIEIHYGRDESVEAVSVHHDRMKSIQVRSSEMGWQSEATTLTLERRVFAIAGVLEDNLFLSMSRLGEGAALTIAFANVFAWDIDFHSQSRTGDRFALVAEKLYRDGEFVGYGDLKAAQYVSYLAGEREFSAFLYEDPWGKRDYYDREGNSLRKAFLRAPVEFERISSGFSYNRLHPVHNRRMPHLGVDYAAAAGTPVYSVGDGVVTDVGFRGGGGNQVTIRHAMGYTSKYLHLSKFAPGLRAGQRVEQKQVIGYVGSTGTATGAHLDFRLSRHDKPVNPLTQIFPPGPPVAAELREDFDAAVRLLATRLQRSLVDTIALADE